mmetsp:Transcript_11503/g.36374  ORF Transcript_11503/g.36374 Transcript_11503/m.36374 type:complete len:224 (+) Transcript_11503:348-1019(+)
MDFELKQRAEKLKREQEERTRKQRAKVQREIAAKELARKTREAHEELADQRRAEAVALEQEAVEKALEDDRRTGGISFKASLLPVKGKGGGDKLTLPQSALESLSGMGALEKGPMLFEIKSHTGAVTHAGVLEFSAEEGTVGLPQKVASCLGVAWGPDGAAPPNTPALMVRYVRLPRGSYAVLQPAAADFSDVFNQRAVLEAALRGLTVLTVGDVRRAPKPEP